MAQLSINWKDKHLIFLVIVLLMGFFLRTYRIADTFDFNGDLGRDALIAKRIIVDREFTLIGPRASGGDFYLGPLYYYLIIPSLFLSGFSPLGPVYLTVFLNLLTIFLIYFVASKLFTKVAGNVAALLYTVSPLTVAYGRVSGNYAALPLLGLLAVYFLWHWLRKRKLHLMGFWALILGLSIQLHYSVVVLVFFGLFCLGLYRINPRFYWKHFLAAILIFGLLCSPLLLFDIRHDWVNFKGFTNYLLNGSGQQIRSIIGAPAWSFSGSLVFFTKTVYGSISPVLSEYLPASLIITAVFLAIRIFRKKLKKEQFFFLALIAFTAIFSSFYQGYLADYYLIFLFTAPIVFFSSLVSPDKKTVSRPILISAIVLCAFNLSAIKFDKINRNLEKISKVAETIAGDVSAESSFNLFLKRETPFWSSASEYRYLTEIFGKRALGPTEYGEAEILYYIDETDERKPLASQNWEITEFCPRKVIDNWQVDNISIYKLSKQ